MMNDESIGRQFEVLLREFAGNVGMAGFVCGKPVEMMPQSEQDRLFNGFFNQANLNILKSTKENFENAENLNISEAQLNRSKEAVLTLESITEIFELYLNSKINRNRLKSNIREILEKPIPEEVEELCSAALKLVEMVEFLAEQKPDSKDSWDKNIDTAQMYDVLSRFNQISSHLKELDQEALSANNLTAEHLDKGINSATKCQASLESFFRAGSNSEGLDQIFDTTAQDLLAIWPKRTNFTE